MDPPYEHVLDDRDLIQGSAGETTNVSWPMRVGEDRMEPYRGHRATYVAPRRLRGMNRRLDPLEHLPPELSTFVITQALPPHGINALPSTYPSRLIDLTTVSKKWQSFLFSTPVLWSELHIDERLEDFLATLSVFVRLSSNAPVKLFLPSKPTGIDWTGLASVLLPAAERVTCLHIGSIGDDKFELVHNALSNLLERLCRLPRLKEVNFDGVYQDLVSFFQIKSSGLPSTVKVNVVFPIGLSENFRGSGTRSRFFDVAKYNMLGTLGQSLVPPSQPNLLVEYFGDSDKAYIISNGITLLQLESGAERLVECNCFEQVVHRATFTLHYLQVQVNLSQTEDLLDCLRMLMHLQVLLLYIAPGDRKITRDHILSDITSHDLRIFDLELLGGVENQGEAQKPLGDLFSALGILYPSVEEVHLRGGTWVGFKESYLQDLKALKSLTLAFERSSLALPSAPITLQSVQRLEMQGVTRLDNLRTPNLLKLVLQLGGGGTKLDHLGPFPRGLRSLAIELEEDMEDFNFTYLDCPDLRDLSLETCMSRASWGYPWLPNLVSIKVISESRPFTDPSSNQLCIALLCYPWRLPSLRELHFDTCVEWDVLFLLLKRRNCDESGVQRIDTVTLPFIPFAFHKLFARLLAGEIVELPSLTSLSLEATRELVFDPNVPGCFACLKNMRPGCTARAVSDVSRYWTPADMLYPTEDPVPEEISQEIRDWLNQRWELVEMWKASYEEFALNFRREYTCAYFLYALL